MQEPATPQAETQNGSEIRSPFGDYLGIVVDKRHKGLCRLSCMIETHHLNRGGSLHGGVLLALMDHAAGLADSWVAESEAPRFSVTLDLSGHFTRAMTSGRATVEARIVSEGRGIYFASTDVRDESGELVAFGSSTHKRLRDRGG